MIIRYLPVVKRYLWIVGACVLVAIIAGVIILRAIPPQYVASSTLVVQASSAATGTSTLTSDPTKDIAEANNYAAEVPSRNAMTLIAKLYPQLKQHGYSVYSLMHNVTATPGTSAATITITATASTPRDAVLLSDDVASGFITFIAQQQQAQLNTLRGDLQTQLASYEKTKSGLEQKILSSQSTVTTTTTGGTTTNTSSNGSSFPGSTSSSGSSSTNNNVTTVTSTDPAVAVYTADLSSLNTTIDGLQAQIAQLPSNAVSDASAIQLAAPADVSLSAKPYVIAGATLAAGLIVGLLLLGLAIYLDRRLLGEDQVTVKLGLPYLGGVSGDATLKAAPASPGAIAAQESANIFAGLRLTRLAAPAAHDQPGGVLLLTSTREAEGKTTLACALAGAIVRSGGTVALIDANLRHPAAHTYLGTKPVGSGLSGLLTSEEPSEEALMQVGDTPGFWLLPAGSAIETPTLLLQERLPEILAQIRQKVDVVLMDGPDLLSSADASLLANMADQVALVVDARHDQVGMLERAIDLLTSLSGTPIGIILNRLPAKRPHRYYASALERRGYGVATPGLLALPSPRAVVPSQVTATNGHNMGTPVGATQ